jgi:YHS domain-containing protein
VFGGDESEAGSIGLAYWFCSIEHFNVTIQVPLAACNCGNFECDSDSGLSFHRCCFSHLTSPWRFSDDVWSLGGQRLTTHYYSQLSGARSKPRSSRVQDTLSSGSLQVGSVRYSNSKYSPRGPEFFFCSVENDIQGEGLVLRGYWSG